MSLLLPLEVRVATNKADRIITNTIRSLKFRSIVPGGFSSATMALSRPLNAEPDEILYYARVYIYDRRTGRTVWEGRLEDPGRSAGDEGDTWDLSCVGGSGHAQDMTVCVVYVDRRFDQWFRVENVTKGADFSVSADPGATSTTNVDQALTWQFPDGQKIVTNSRVAARYDTFRITGQKLARYNYTADMGRTTTSLQLEALTRLDGGTGEVSRTTNFSTSGVGTAPKVITTDYPNTRTTLDLRIIWSGGAATIGDDDSWASVPDVVVLGTRYQNTGVELTAASNYTTDTVLASDVVADLLGRCLPAYLGNGAIITVTSYGYSQLAYEDGATAAEILADLMELEPGYYWAAWESDTILTGDKFYFEWVAWPTTVFYEADIIDGFASPGGAEGLYNRVLVRWRDSKGKFRNTIRTQTVGILTDVGVTRQGFIDLSDEVGSSANAVQAGDAFLADHRFSPNNGTLTIARPVRDLNAGGWADPWDIRPGRLIRVRGITPTVVSLNASDRDSVTVFRIVATEFDTSTGAVTLELDTYSYSLARAVAQARKKPRRKR